MQTPTTGMHVVPGPDKVASMRNVILSLAYGIGTLVALWALGGGEAGLFWTRVPILALSLALIAGGLLLFLNDRKSLFAYRRESLTMGLISALIAALPTIAILWIGKSLSPESVPVLKTGVEFFKPSGYAVVLLASLVLAPSHEIISRGYLVPAWGIPGVAFLDALAIGFGSQKLLPFLLYWALGYFWGFLSKQYGFVSALVSRCVWGWLTLTALYFLT